MRSENNRSEAFNDEQLIAKPTAVKYRSGANHSQFSEFVSVCVMKQRSNLDLKVYFKISGRVLNFEHLGLSTVHYCKMETGSNLPLVQ